MGSIGQHAATHRAPVAIREAQGLIRALSLSADRLRQLLTGAGTLVQLGRFSAVGLVSSALYAVAFVGLSASLGSLGANLVAMVASTVLANELHRRLTFHASAEVGWLRTQLQGGSLAIVGMVTSSLALLSLDSALPSAGWLLQVLMLGAVSGGIGLVRFAALRAWVFTVAGDPRRSLVAPAPQH